MKTIPMRTYFLAPLLVLAMVACAKRDNEFAKRAGEQKAAQEKIKQDQQKKTDESNDQGTDQTKETTPAEGSDANTVTVPPESTADSKSPENSEQPQASDESQKNSEVETEGETAAATEESDPTLQAKCENKISLTANADEEIIGLRDVFTGEEGTYILQSAEFFLDVPQAANAKHLQINGIGTPWILSESQLAQSQPVESKNLQVVCQSPDLAQNNNDLIKPSFSLPYDLSQKTGKAKRMRTDKVKLSPTNQQVESKIEAADKDPAASFDFNAFYEKPIYGKNSTTKVVLKRLKGSNDFKMVLQIITPSAAGDITKTIQGTYSLKK